jgi:siderophore synthetase component
MFFEKGFFSEPHLQNVVVGLENGWPTRLYLRDLDNCKVVDGGPAARRLAGLDAATRDELLLPRDVAWPRFVYCLFVNHLLEAAAALADDDTLREVALWSVVRMVLDEETSRVPADWRAEWDALREGAPLPAKGNLITRFRKGRDREAPFLRIPSPLRFCRGERR